MMDNSIFRCAHTLGKLVHWPLTFLAVLCIIMLWLPSVTRRLWQQNLLFFRLLSLTLIYFIAVHVIGTPLPRYSIPTRPIVIVLGIVAIQLAYDSIHRPATPPVEHEHDTQ